KPIAGMRVTIPDAFGAGSAITDRHGRYRILRAEDEPSIMVFTSNHDERYLTVVRKLTDAQGLGEIAADFNIPPGVVLSGAVPETGPDRPIVPAPRKNCHDTVPGPLVAGNIAYFPLSSNTALRGTPTGLYFEGIPTGIQNYCRWATIDGDGRFRIVVPPGPGVLFVQSAPGMPMEAGWLDWKEADAPHPLFPSTRLATPPTHAV